jgi:hypothetical protein
LFQDWALSDHKIRSCVVATVFEIEIINSVFGNQKANKQDVLADVVIASAFPEIFGMPVVIIQRYVSDFIQVLRI